MARAGHGVISSREKKIVHKIWLHFLYVLNFFVVVMTT